MTKVVTLERLTGDGKTTPGALYVDGEFICFNVERTSRLIPPGRYPLRLGATGKTMPDGFRGITYEICDVPGRTHIKIHVANFYKELEGCSGPNSTLDGRGTVSGGASKLATRQFMLAMKEDGQLVDEAVIDVVAVGGE